MTSVAAVYDRSVKVYFFILQVTKLRGQMLQNLQDELNKIEATITDAHLRRNCDEHFAWIRRSGLTLTPKEVKKAKKEIHQFVRLIFCLG